MNHHAKRLCKDLEALDFRRDYEGEQRSNARRIYFHANDPAQRIKVFDCMNDSTITIAHRLAARIVGAATSESVPAKAKERARVARQAERARRDREDQERAERAAAKQRQIDYERQRIEAAQQARAAHIARREVEQLMRHGYGR